MSKKILKQHLMSNKSKIPQIENQLIPVDRMQLLLNEQVCLSPNPKRIGATSLCKNPIGPSSQ